MQVVNVIIKKYTFLRFFVSVGGQKNLQLQFLNWMHVNYTTALMECLGFLIFMSFKSMYFNLTF